MKSRKPISPAWLIRIRERLEDKFVTNFKSNAKIYRFKNIYVINKFLEPILKAGEKEEEYITKEFHKRLYDNKCICDICKK